MEIVGFTSKHKIADRLEEEPYRVLDKPNADNPVLKVIKEDEVGRVKHASSILLLTKGM